MDEIVKSIKAFLYDRTVSPLFGAYICAWSVWNYRVIVALLDGDATLKEKMDFINSYFDMVTYHIGSQTYYVWGQVIHGFLAPVLLTLIYIYVYPKLAKPVYSYSLEKQKELREIKQAKDNMRLLTHEESRNITKEIEQIRQLRYEEDQKHRERVASLVETINTLEASQKPTLSAIPIESLGDLVSKEIILNPDELSNELRSAVEERPIGEFELSDLFEANEWKSLSESTRKAYGRSFKKVVERGDFVDVAVSKKGSGNQLIYLKQVAGSSKESSDYENTLITKLNQLSFSKKAFSEEQRTILFKKVVTYFAKNNITEDMFDVLLIMVRIGASLEKAGLYSILENTYNNIEVDNIVRKMRTKDLIKVDGLGDFILTDIGKEMAVESGLTTLIKKVVN